jgi:Asparagine synthase/Glutamine amidotransferase domain
METEQYWIARFDNRPPPPVTSGAVDLVFESETRRSRRLSISGVNGDASVAAAEDFAVFLDGVIHDRDRLIQVVPRAGETDDAELVRRAYQEVGIRALSLLRGFFTVLIWDGRTDSLLAARDPLGVLPLFFAQTGDGFALSPSPEALVRRGGISDEVDRVAVARWVMNSAIDAHATFYDRVRRVPQGHALEVGPAGFRVRRQWDPAKLGPVPDDANPDQAVDRFDELLGQAVDRCLAFGPAAVFLSGGVDSGTVAAVAASRTRANDLPDPLALSMVFPGRADEETMQRAVAADLGLPQVVVPLAIAAGPKGVLAAGLEMSAWGWAPCINPWEASFNVLVREATTRGYPVVLTGEGGNHLLEVDWLLAADLMRAFDLAGLIELWRCEQAYFPRRPTTLARMMLWQSGLRPLLRDTLEVALRGAAPQALDELRRRRWARSIPNWALPDRGLREKMTEDSVSRSPLPPFEPYRARGQRLLIDSYELGNLMETAFPVRERFGAWRLNPFFDPDLVTFLCAMPPRVLRLGGRLKGLAHASLERRAHRGWAGQLRPAPFDQVLRLLVRQEGPNALRTLGGTPILSELGIVDGEQVRRAAEGTSKGSGPQYHEIWQVLSCEAWLQARF